MPLDTRTILVLTVLHSAAIGVALIAAARRFASPVRHSMNNWGSASLVLAVAFLLLALRGIITDFLSIVVGNTLLILSLGEYYQSFRTFDGDPPARWPPALLAFVLGGLACLFLYVDNNISARTAAGAIIVAVLLLTIAARLLVNHEAPPTAIRRITGIGYCLLAGSYLFRAASALYLGRKMPLFLTNSGAEMALFAFTSMAFLLITLSYLLMCNERTNEELKHLAITDPLTGLANRRAADEFLENEIERVAHSGASLAMLMIDVDGLKVINDTHGHRAGDMVLTTVADVIRRNCRRHDVAARLGGDEFALALPGIDKEGAAVIARRLSSQVTDAILLVEGVSIQLGISVGTAFLAPHNPSYDDLIRRADEALYAVKLSRKGRAPKC